MIESARPVASASRSTSARPDAWSAWIAVTLPFRRLTAMPGPGACRPRPYSRRASAQSPVEPVEDHLQRLAVVLLEHHPVAVAVHAVVGKPDALDVAAGLL